MGNGGLAKTGVLGDLIARGPGPGPSIPGIPGILGIGCLDGLGLC